MTKRNFIALADAIREANHRDITDDISVTFKPRAIEALANFCQAQNSNFKRDRWLGYIAGTNGRNGGKVAA